MQCYPPYTVPGTKAQLLHVCVPRSVQCIHPWTTESRAKCLQYFRLGEKLILYIEWQCIELLLKCRVEGDFARHADIMLFTAYVVKGIIASDVFGN